MKVKSLSRVWLFATPWTVVYQAPLSMEFSRQEYWSGLPFPSPVHESEKWKWSRSAVSDPQQPHGPQLSRLLRPWDFPGKSTGVGCHCLLRSLHYYSVITGSYLSKMAWTLKHSNLCSFSATWRLILNNSDSPSSKNFPDHFRTVCYTLLWVIFLPYGLEHVDISRGPNNRCCSTVPWCGTTQETNWSGSFITEGGGEDMM